MTTVLDRQKRTLVNKVGRRARARFGKDKGLSLERFIRHYYEHVPPQDIVGQDPANLLGAALAHWTFGAKRAARKAKVRVYNPRRKEHGWEADHTVVEIVNDDMPFLVDSVTAALNQRDLVVHLVIHPIFRVRRSRDGGMTDIVDGERGPGAEAFLRFEATRQSGERLDEIGSAIETVLADVRAAVEDWQTMRDSLKGIVDELEMRPPRLPAGEVIEARDFLDWTHDDHFTFLGYRDYDFATAGGRTRSGINAKTGLGILRDPRVIVFRGLRSLHTMPPEVRAFVRRPDLLMVTKSNVKSTVHRPVHLDVIGVKRFDDRDRVVGQRLFVGLFTSSAYSLSPREIPVLRRKLRTIFDRAGFPAASHTGKALTHILETYPRDELFQASDETLFEIAMGILNLQERQRVALFLRRDDFERFMSCLLYIPRDRYNTDLRNRMGRILEEAFGGKLTAYYTQLDDSPLARLHLIIQTTPGRLEPYDTAVIEERLLQAARSWSDRLEEALVDARGEEQGSRLFRRYRNAFPPGYVERFSAQHAITDIAHVEDTAASGELGMNLYRPAGIPGDRFRFKIYNPHRSVPLSDTLPMLEHMSLKVVDEVPHAVNPDMDGLDLVMIHDFGLETRDGSDVDLAAVRGNFQEAFRRVWRGEMESDEFNSLLLRAGLTWREVVVLRAYCKYLRQAGIAFSQSYMAQTLSNSPRLARLIVDLFLTLFDPAGTKDADKRAERIRRHLSEGLDAVESADEDRILRRFLNIVESSVRTNFFQRAAGGAPKPYLSIKLDSRRVDELPLPRPMFDVFVYSPRVEAIHLRGGLVARGGIRWSDRREDFRTEILGLMKAQTVKNAVIVPVGAKGGFVVKRPPAAGGREALLGEGIECYKTLMRGLLDISDNLKGTRVVRPKNVVRRDGDDPYLVVAADKGTATFSDIANGISTEYDFWLGDAFASGGSVGYDHKKMGITARGAWESVKRHFREVGTDIQNRDFTVVGVGDMSGDVFGNAMLLSPHIKLIGAFNHLHIFVDPDPDPARSFRERKRLFGLPRSSWIDYESTLISRGGGVFERRAKSISLSPRARKLLRVAKDTVTPNELIHALLRAQVDLLWFGGIGTYVKASDESHTEVGDRANDATRVNASELRCRVIGEGANLGVTQRGRVEYSLAGGRLNADSVDNSGGVDCSDHEVNIKILLDSVVAGGAFTEKQRNALLANMTDEVGALVLNNNYLQSQAITLVTARANEVFDDQIRMMRMLERADRLNREVESLPDDEGLEERQAARRGFTRPEVAVLMAHAKIWLYDQLLESDLPDNPRLADDLLRYFPTPLRKKFRAAIGRHRLRREIIAATVTDSMINRVGGSLVAQMVEKTGMPPADIARAYIIAREVFALHEVWAAIEGLDNMVPADVQIAMLLESNRIVERGTLWFLRHADQPIDIGANIATFGEGVATVAAKLETVLPDHYRSDLHGRAAAYVEKGVPEDLALRLAGMVNLASGCEIVRLARGHGASVIDVAELYFEVGARFQMGRLRATAERLEPENHWQQLAVAALIDDLYAHQVRLASQMLDGAKPKTGAKRIIAAWAEAHGAPVQRTESLLAEIWDAETVDLPMLFVVSRRLQALT